MYTRFLCLCPRRIGNPELCRDAFSSGWCPASGGLISACGVPCVTPGGVYRQARAIFPPLPRWATLFRPSGTSDNRELGQYTLADWGITFVGGSASHPWRGLLSATSHFHTAAAVGYVVTSLRDFRHGHARPAAAAVTSFRSIQAKSTRIIHDVFWGVDLRLAAWIGDRCGWRQTQRQDSRPYR
jgi:hypothetical protein